MSASGLAAAAIFPSVHNCPSFIGPNLQSPLHPFNQSCK
jgi:hypothetical protein